MKEKIYTIPINEAFDLCTECAVCEFEKKEELSRIEYALGASMMEPDERIFTNKMGFCQRHSSMMLGTDNKLSLALVMKTHMDEIIDSMNECIVELENTDEKSSIFKKRENTSIDRASDKIYEKQSTCAVCKRLSDTMDKFTENLLYMYDSDNSFREKFLSSKGFCLKHFSYMLKKAQKTFKGEKLKDFSINLFKLEKENFQRVCDDTDWFTKKFDYRYANEDWKNSKDAPQRACMKVAGYTDK